MERVARSEPEKFGCCLSAAKAEMKKVPENDGGVFHYGGLLWTCEIGPIGNFG